MGVRVHALAFRRPRRRLLWGVTVNGRKKRRRLVTSEMSHIVEGGRRSDPLVRRVVDALCRRHVLLRMLGVTLLSVAAVREPRSVTLRACPS